jgi:phage repressor protein C with HTH and peptisase S24 domain
MMSEDPRDTLDRLARQGGHSYSTLSRVIRRNAAYIQQYIKRGTPARLEEEDRRLLARFLGVSESLLGGPAREEGDSITRIRRLSVEASAGPGRVVEGETELGHYGFDIRWLRSVSGSRPEDLSIVQVSGDSMAPTLVDGDDILVDHSASARRLRDGIYVLRLDDTLMVKRLALSPLAGTLSIISDNPSYPTWSDCPLDGVDVIGRVSWAGRRFR